jgi:hypothetical protein
MFAMDSKKKDQGGIDVAITSHRRLMQNIIGHIYPDQPLNHGLLDSRHCAFNDWLHGLGFIQHGNLQQYNETNRLHEQVHRLGLN